MELMENELTIYEGLPCIFFLRLIYFINDCDDMVYLYFEEPSYLVQNYLTSKIMPYGCAHSANFFIDKFPLQN